MNKTLLEKRLLMNINVNGLSEFSASLVENYALKSEIDIIGVTETKRDKVDPKLLPGYLVESSRSKTSNPRQGGVALFWKTDIMGTPLDSFSNGEIDDVFAVFKLLSTTFMIGCIYIKPEQKHEIEILKNTLLKALAFKEKHKIQECIFMGDFNARHHFWGDHRYNDAGLSLCNFLTSNNLHVLNSKEATFTSINGGSSVIDLYISSGQISHLSVSTAVDYETELGSGAPDRGHYPVLLQMTSDRRWTQKREQKAWNWEKVDWNIFKQASEGGSSKILTELREQKWSSDKLWEKILNLTQEAVALSTVRRNTCPHSKPHWNSDLSALSVKLQEASRNYKKRSDPINRYKLEIIREEFKSCLKEAEQSWIKKQTETLNHKKGPEFWKTYKKLVTTSSDTKLGIFICNGQVVADNEERAKLLFNHFFAANHLSNASFNEDFNEFVKREVEKTKRMNCVWSEDEEISMLELEKGIEEVKTTRKSQDPDEIHPTVIKYMGPGMKQLILIFFNLVLQESNWPFRNNVVKFIPKNGKKSYLKVENFRPLTLSSYFGKLLERILKTRLHKHLERHALLDPDQEGFQKNKSTGRYLVNFISQVEEALERKEFPIAVMIDFQKAFDSVWINGLLYKLNQMGIHGKMWLLLKNFLENRVVRLKLEEFESEQFPIVVGLPQGSVLSPILFSIFVSDISYLCLGTNFKYADDLTLLVTGETLSDACKNMQFDLNKVSDWLNDWRILTAPDKTAAIVFQRKKSPDVSTDIELQLCSTKIPFKKAIKVLGVIVENRLVFEEQLKTATEKAERRWTILKRKFYENAYINPEVLITLVKTCVLPVWTYLAYLWADRAKIIKSTLWKDILEVCSSCSFNPKKEILEVILDLPPIDIQIAIHGAKFVAKTVLMPPTDNIKKILDTGRTTIANKLRSDHKLLKSAYGYSKQDVDEAIVTTWNKRLRNTSTDSSWVVRNESFLPPGISRGDVKKIIQLMTEQSFLGLFMFKIGWCFSPLCTCLEEEETSEHFLMRCPFYRLLREAEGPSDLKSLKQSNSWRIWRPTLNFIEASRRLDI